MRILLNNLPFPVPPWASVWHVLLLVLSHLDIGIVVSGADDIPERFPEFSGDACDLLPWPSSELDLYVSFFAIPQPKSSSFECVRPIVKKLKRDSLYSTCSYCKDQFWNKSNRLIKYLMETLYFTAYKTLNTVLACQLLEALYLKKKKK